MDIKSAVKSFVTKHPTLTYTTLGTIGGYLGLYTLSNFILPSLKRRPSGLTSTSSGEDVLKRLKNPIECKGGVTLITGANVGLGKETARVLAKTGMILVLAGRSIKSLESAKQDILKESPETIIHILELDLADQQGIKKSVVTFEKMNLSLDVLILNAGYMSPVREVTKDGFEYSIGVNHLGHFTLTNLLLPFMKKETQHEKRIVVLGSELHRTAPGKILWDDFQMEKKYAGFQPTYSHSKLANLMFTLALNRKLERDNVPITVNCVHPGIIHTELHRKDFAWFKIISEVFMRPIWGLVRKNLQAGASTTVYAAVHQELKNRGGHYLSNCGIEQGLTYAYDESEQEKLWDLSEQLTGVKYQ